MCLAAAAPLHKLSTKFHDKFDIGNRIARKMGYAGLADPIREAIAKQGGTKTSAQKRAIAMGEQATRDNQPGVPQGPPEHARRIAEFKSKQEE